MKPTTGTREKRIRRNRRMWVGVSERWEEETELNKELNKEVKDKELAKANYVMLGTVYK
jgi:hypothetical protein